MNKQLARLRRKPQIVVATPGRLLDHMNRGTLKLDRVHTMVLDEADEMLQMGFVKDVCKIIEATPGDRQLVMFSATTNRDVMTISWKYQNNPVEVVIEATEENKPNIAQYIIQATTREKYDRLLYIIDSDAYHRMMVFCNTKSMTARLTERLKRPVTARIAFTATSAKACAIKSWTVLNTASLKFWWPRMWPAEALT